MAPTKKRDTKKDKDKRDKDKKKDKNKMSSNKSIFQCSKCHKILSDLTSYRIHETLHNNEYPYSCELCAYKCKIKKYLARHVKKVHNKANGPHCTVCGKVFHFQSNLNCHMRVHTGERPYKCQVCGKTYSSTYCLSMHKLIHTNEKPYECRYCDYACRDSSTLRRHQERHMGIRRTFPCKKCKVTFKTRKSLKFHMDEVHFGINIRKHACDKCDKAFKTRAALSTHIKSVHEKSLLIDCDICGRTITKNNLSSHLKSHVDIRPYKCGYKTCGKKFKDQSSLKKHARIHYPQYQYQCDLCDSRFPRKSRLKEHRKRHASEGGYTCDYCGVSFVTKTYLLVHIKRKHSENAEKFICDECGLVNYSKRAIILHLRYGHGVDGDRRCKICFEVVQDTITLTEHYLKAHNVRHVVIRKRGRIRSGEEIRIKDEPIEIDAEFDFDYDVQKIEIDEFIPHPEYEDTETTLAYSERVLAEDLSRSIVDKDVGGEHPESAFDEFYMEHALEKHGINDPEYAETETSYSKRELQEDLSKTMSEQGERPENAFDEFFVQMMNKPKKKALPKPIVDKRKLLIVKKTVKKMLDESRLRKEMEALEEMRREYNRRIKMANKSGEKRDSTQIKYFKKSNNNNNNTEKSQENSENQENHDSLQNDHDPSPIDDNIDETAHENDKSDQENNNSSQGTDNSSQEHDEVDQETDNSRQELNKSRQENSKSCQGSAKSDQEYQEGGGMADDMSVNLRTRRLKRAGHNSNSEVGAGSSDHEVDRNNKLTFNGHECYICFKLFKTKEDLNVHCKEHFDICNEKMLKKCPFCGYVTNKNIRRHIQIVHKTNISYPYGRITEKNSANGSKYVFEIDKGCELEIIPSISNLNKIACMKIDSKNRKSRNDFLGKTKLVKKGDNWIVEKQPVAVNTGYLLPEFTDEEYKKLKLDGNTYLDRMKKLSYLAKLRGVKMLYPCSGCEKICQTMAALKLHNRRHEENPKQFRPKVWVNRHIEYTTKKRKKIRNNITKDSAVKTPIRRGPVKVIDKKSIDNRRRKPDSVENRFAAPKPVKNKHKCDKELIDFYNTNIRGKDIEFWQFLKIFNKMSRENVNDFKDLENRNDLHFGVHINEDSQPFTETPPVVADKSPVSADKLPKSANKSPTSADKSPVYADKSTVFADKSSVFTETSPVLQKTSSQKKVANKYTRAIMISRKEYMKRNELKKELRKRIEQTNSQ